MPDSLAGFVELTRKQVDAALERYLPRPPACPPVVSDAMRYSVFAGGKRLRPVLALGAADAVHPGATSFALPAACAVELIHTYSLIHDDLPAMDNDTLRRGRPTLHVVYGEGIAILAGDALQAEAFAILAREPESIEGLESRKLHVIQLIGEAAGAGGMVGGQAIDLQAAGSAVGHPLVLDAQSLHAMHLRKTGALIRASALSGAVMAGASRDAAAAIDGWARELGLAFQIIDDVLDVEGTDSTLGKTPGKDAAAAKPTYPSLFGLERSRQLATECAARGHAILEEARLTSSWLPAIAQWVVTRKN